jgi:23S rRNA pseudouridine2605 synthase
MTNQDEREKDRQRSDYSQPTKRKRISTGNKSYEKVTIFKKNTDNTLEKKPLYSSDKTFKKRTDSPYDPDKNSGKPFIKKAFNSSQGSGFKKPYGHDSRPQSRFGKPSDKPNWKNDHSRSGYDIKQPVYHFDEEVEKGPVRLNKYIANTGLCSRREADEYIQAGLISVNGQLITELGSKIQPTDEVMYKEKKLLQERKVYILLNKPKDFVTSVDDPHAKQTVMELVKGACSERIYPVGRLDRMTTGVLLLTNDGELTKKLTHPTSNIRKIYQIFLDKNLKPEDMQVLTEGVTLSDGVVKVDGISYINEEENNLIGIEIHSGRNRVIRRLFEHLGYKVIKLDRIFFAGLTKKGLTRGKWRYLAPKEVGFLKMLKM